MRLGVAATLVDGQRVPGDVEILDGRVTRVGLSPAGQGLAVPGFVDLQVNGFAGVDFLAAEADGYDTAAAALSATGVTTCLPTFISSPLERLARALEAFAQARQRLAAPRLPGGHLEGPFLAPDFAGAHDPANVREPDPGLAEHLLGLAPIQLMTVAPEQPGGHELVSHLVRRGVTVSLGHTGADAAAAHGALDRGARSVTHLYNAMRRWRSRDPGVAGAALARDDAAIMAIVDGVHLAPETSLVAWRAAGQRFVLVSDAIAAAGRGPGTYALGDRTVHVDDTSARLEDGTLAGSVLTMDAAVRNLVELGVDLPEAIDAATAAPASLIGRSASLRPGEVADVAVLDDALTVRRTLVGGAESFAG